MPDDYELYVGIDWATEAHQVCLLDPRGQVLAEQRVAHTGPALAALVTDLVSRVTPPVASPSPSRSRAALSWIRCSSAVCTSLS
jgi:hypothetical protein